MSNDTDKLTPCERCGERTYNPRLCRDCDLAHVFAMMTCSGCQKLRTQTEGQLAEMADQLWGENHRCTCDPKPSTVEE